MQTDQAHHFHLAWSEGAPPGTRAFALAPAAGGVCDCLVKRKSGAFDPCSRIAILAEDLLGSSNCGFVRVMVPRDQLELDIRRPG